LAGKARPPSPAATFLAVRSSPRSKRSFHRQLAAAGGGSRIAFGGGQLVRVSLQAPASGAADSCLLE